MDNRTGEGGGFCTVEVGTFFEAARPLRMAPSTVSKLITDREAARRASARTLDPAPVADSRGPALLRTQLRASRRTLDEMERKLSQGAESAGGTLRVNASMALGVLAVETCLPAFWQAYPNIVVDISLSDEIVDLYLDRTEVASRVGRLQDSGMMA